jgi:hypothetical protein
MQGFDDPQTVVRCVEVRLPHRTLSTAGRATVDMPGAGHALPRMRLIVEPQTGHEPRAIRRRDSLIRTSPV